jgi:hypothetical protein
MLPNKSINTDAQARPLAVLAPEVRAGYLNLIALSS